MSIEHQDNQTPRVSTPRVHGFTLVELLVALGVLLLLTLGINEVFRSVTRVVSVGSGIAETNAAARVIERQLRDDFAAMNRLPADQNFMVIRSRKLGGDLNNDDDIVEEDGERPLYLTEDDRLFDVQAGIDPYSPRSRAVTVRLDEIVFMGLAPQGSVYQSFQQFGRSSDESDFRLESDHPVVAEAALISYGHGLRPFPDLDFNPALEPTDLNSDDAVPVRQFVPDGDFGQRAGEDNTFAIDTANDSRIPSQLGTVGLGTLENEYELVSNRARNEFAGDFFVLRQAALLYGGDALGIRVSEDEILPGPVLDSRKVIPFVRDWEIAARLGIQPSGFAGLPYETVDGRRVRLDDPTAQPIRAQDGGNRVPQPQMRRMGRSDIIAMTRADVQRWLEGLEGPPIDNLDPGNFWDGNENIAASLVPRPDASPWSSGPFEVSSNLDDARNDPVINEVNGRIFGQPDDALWPRQGWLTNAQDLNRNGLVDEYEVRLYGDGLAANAPASIRTIDRRTPVYDADLPFGGDERGRRVQIANTRGLVSAIAGVVTRVLAETEPSRLNRGEREIGGGADATLVTESDPLMDLHAVLATRCSSLEIAWSNGWTWAGGETQSDLPEEWEVDANDDGVIDRVLRTGDLIWFDYEMSQLEFIAAAFRDFSAAEFQEFLRRYPMPDLIAEVPKGARAFNFVPDPADNYGRDITTFFANHLFDLQTNGRLARQIGVFTPDQGDPAIDGDPQFRRNLMLRNVGDEDDRIESGVYDWLLSMGSENPEHEYLKVFPFRRPLADARGRYGEAWEKPSLVRFRFTLHDAQFRVEGGRTYEFVMGMD